MKGNILTPAGWVLGEIHAGPDGRIARIDGVPAAPADNDAPYVLPGFVDLLNHGGGGKDFMDGDAAMPVILRAHVRFGTTSLLASTMTAPHEVLLPALQRSTALAGNARAAARACSACIWKGRTSTRASWARSRRPRPSPRIAKWRSTSLRRR